MLEKTNKAKPYCTCHTREELKEKPWLGGVYTKYREVNCSDGNTCNRCGHYVIWMIDFDSKLHNGHKVRKHKNIERENKKFNHEYFNIYKVHL